MKFHPIPGVVGIPDSGLCECHVELSWVELDRLLPEALGEPLIPRRGRPGPVRHGYHGNWDKVKFLARLDWEEWLELEQPYEGSWTGGWG